MHSYVVTSDGRAYTAISRIPTEIGSRMLTLNTVGGIIGWMFAEMKGPLAHNGYVYTGRLFIDICFLRSGYICIYYTGKGLALINQCNIGKKSFIQ